MKIIEKTMEMRGMRRTEIINYFLSIAEENIGNWKFKGIGWEVIVDEESIASIGRLQLPSTNVTFRCDEKIIDEVIYAFRLKSLSAGG